MRLLSAEIAFALKKGILDMEKGAAFKASVCGCWVYLSCDTKERQRLNNKHGGNVAA